VKSRLSALVSVAAALLLPLVSTGSQTAEEITREKILTTGPDWQQKYDQYQPDPDMLEALKSKLGTGVRIDVYLGLWCPDSLNNVPQFIRIVDRLGAGVTVRYFSLPKKADKSIRYFVENLKVDRVPTFLFYRGDKEIGRIVENPKIGMIEDFMDIVFMEN
jgi:thioredoxin 1